MTVNILVFTLYLVTAVTIVLLALLNELPIIMVIAYDKAPIALRSVRWDTGRALAIASSQESLAP